jgi:hypothetical protein
MKRTIPLLLVALLSSLVVAGENTPPANPYDSTANCAPAGKIDELVFARLQKLKVEPAAVCTDGVFVRRVFLDVIGTLPSSEEAKEFLADKAPNKRATLVDRLLARKEYADYWAMKWSDVLRIKAEFPINLWPDAAQAYHHWIQTSLKDNKPYDQLVREMLVSSGSNFRSAPVNFYRALQSKEPPAVAQAVALVFMGCRAENWPAERLAGMGGFFSRIGYKATGEWKEEIVFFDPEKPVVAAVFPDGTPAKLSPGQDPRAVFADWLTAKENPWFARNIVNRVWYWLLGRGIIHEPDDVRPDNPASNPELLAYLEKELIAARYDLKHVFRLILNSTTYQLSSIPKSKEPAAAENFASYPLRRLEAEVLIDALCEITGTTERYSSAIPEPYTFIPEDQRSIALEDGSISSSFLELFGRPPRDTGLESERNNRPTAAQRLHMLNSSHIQRKIEDGPKMRRLLLSKADRREIVDGLYLTILSRYPTDDEIKVLQQGGPLKSIKTRDGLVDLAWALVNSAEFLYRH